MEPFMGMISMFGFSFAPANWAFCNGQLIPINQNQALFALLSNVYGGDGQTTFGLPNLQSRVPVHFGQGPGLSSYALGETNGTESINLTQQQMPVHTHAAVVTANLYGETAAASVLNPLGNMLATPAAGNQNYAPPVAADNKLMASGSVVATATIAAAGGSQPVGILPPSLAVNFCIALQGYFPSRN